MSDYTKTTNFAAKDALAAGNSGKVVRGSEIDTEFNNIATAVATKANSASPTFTGTPAAPTASSGTNTTQLATTAFVQTAVTGTNNTITSDNIYTGKQTFRDNKFEITDDSDTTKKVAFQVSGVATATTRTLTIPDKDGTLAFTTDIASAATLSSSVSATYSIAGTSMTISKTSHGYSVGDKLYLNFTSGTAVDGNFTVTTVVNSGSFTVTYGSSLTTSGNVTMYKYTTGTVDIASSDETLVGTNTLKAATPKGVIDAILNNFNASGSQLLADDGYQKFPGGLILQWGKVTSTNDAAETFSFPISFPTKCVGAFTSLPGTPNLSPITVTASAFTFDRNNDTDGSVSIFYFALGY